MATTNHPTKTWIRERFEYWQEQMLLNHFDFVRKVRQLDLNESMEAAVRDMNETLVSHFSNILMKIEGQNGTK